MRGKRLAIAVPVIAAALLLAVILPLSSSSRSGHAGTGTEAETVLSLNEMLSDSLCSSPGMEKMDARIGRFLKQWEIKGASIAVMRNDSLLYAKGYGFADEEKGEKMTPGHILRMASVSKLITAAGIMVLQERGQLSLQDTVFGEHGILNVSLFTAAIKEKAKFGITVEQLLRHKAGFTNSRLSVC